MSNGIISMAWSLVMLDMEKPVAFPKMLASRIVKALEWIDINKKSQRTFFRFII